MRLNYPDYIKLVKRAYEEKRSKNELSVLLAQSSPAKIRQACLHLYKEHYEKEEHQVIKKDEQILKAFFGPAETGKEFLKLIQGFETDKFRPLDNYLKGNTDNTDQIKLELLAWLIDFQHRPFAVGKEFRLTEEETNFIRGNNEREIQPEADKTVLEEDKEIVEACMEKETADVTLQPQENLAASSIIPLKEDKPKKRYKRAILVFLSFIVCVGGMYALWQYNQNANNVCVYWKDDHYEQVDCNDDPKGRIIITLNREKAKSFRRITQKDTMTEWSIGKAYYIKDSNIIKLYTEAGNYPEDLKRNLRVLTQHIYDNHVHKKDTSGKDSLGRTNIEASNKR